MTHGNVLWDSRPTTSVFSEEVELANKLSFPFPAFPQVGQQGSTFLLGQKKNKAISPPAGLVLKDVSPSPASPVGNTWMHPHDVSSHRDVFYGFKQKWKHLAHIINLAKERIHVKHYTCSSL